MVVDATFAMMPYESIESNTVKLIGDQTQCPSRHFRNMRLVLNTAFCGSVAGNRFQIDCKNQSKSFKSCNSYVKSQPAELDEAYWKIRGVYVYRRSWQQAWLSK